MRRSGDVMLETIDAGDALNAKSMFELAVIDHAEVASAGSGPVASELSVSGD